jgi:predicted transcriptional regulator
LPLADEVRQSLLEILQKLDILESLSHREKQKVAAHLDELIKETLQSRSDPQHVSKLLAMIGKVAPPLAGDISQSVFVGRCSQTNAS